MKFLIVAALALLAIGSTQADYPAKGGYGGHHGGHVPCGANLLVGCAPHVAHVPCHPVHGGHHAPAPAYHHAPAPAHHAPAPAYHHPAPVHHAPAPAYHHAAPAHHAPAKY
ncbi:splicing factor 3A subunit 2-like [Anopheles aquasalis]|uniref:splicing factor 3A subunit 2-like n=1 Tax=Anopheles aquasalis TaxID=42839 RepID=UPI00215A24EB|nr:splicing factor 3A subunit 2-like [Anopheles aquasalis]